MKSERAQEKLEQALVLARHRLEQRADDLPERRHRHVVDDERLRPPRLDPQLAVPGVQRADEHEHAHADAQPGERTGGARAHRAIPTTDAVALQRPAPGSTLASCHSIPPASSSASRSSAPRPATRTGPSASPGRRPGRGRGRCSRSRSPTSRSTRRRDAAGNDWYTLRGSSDRTVLIGGHLDSVPNGGWLDGCLNVLAGAEVLRRIAEDGTPPVTVRLVDWADEEGARFGRSLFGSSAAAGSMADQDELRKLVDRDGISLPEAVGRFGVDLDTALEARTELAGRGGVSRAPHRAGAGARVDRPAARSGARHVRRRAPPDPLDGAGRACGLDPDGQATRRARRRRQARALAARDRGRRRAAAPCARRAVSSASRASSPRWSRPPSSSSTSDISTRDARGDARAGPGRCPSGSPRRRTSTVAWERIWSIEPILFDDELIGFADEAIMEVAGTSHRLPSGPLHDAAEVSRPGCRR